jgi:hypothetical protein
MGIGRIQRPPLGRQRSAIIEIQYAIIKNFFIQKATDHVTDLVGCIHSARTVGIIAGQTFGIGNCSLESGSRDFEIEMNGKLVIAYIRHGEFPCDEL